jgi:glutamate synthase domain-containing protein 3
MILERRLKVGDLFENLGREERQKEDRNVEVVKSPCLEWLLKKLIKFNKEAQMSLNAAAWDSIHSHIERDLYQDAIKVLKPQPFPITARDIENLCIISFENKDENKIFGAYLNACINKSCDSKFNLITQGYLNPPNYLGTFNREKEIKVIGNVGSSIGYEMSGGIMAINGNVRYAVGERMIDGEIRIDGDCEGAVGENMAGGEITINGNVKYDVGNKMRNGVIHIRGDILNSPTGICYEMIGGEIFLDGENIPQISENIKGGNVYHSGKPIVINGRKV